MILSTLIGGEFHITPRIRFSLTKYIHPHKGFRLALEILSKTILTSSLHILEIYLTVSINIHNLIIIF